MAINLHNTPATDASRHDLVKGAADLLVLSVLADAPLYGYAITKQVAAKSGGAIRLTSPLLRMDFVAGVAVTSSGRQYEFSGPPTVDRAAHQLITANALRRGLHGAADVSELWWQALMHGLDGLTQEALASVLIPARGAAPDTVPSMDQDRPSSPG